MLKYRNKSYACICGTDKAKLAWLLYGVYNCLFVFVDQLNNHHTHSLLRRIKVKTTQGWWNVLVTGIYTELAHMTCATQFDILKTLEYKNLYMTTNLNKRSNQIDKGLILH